MVWIVFFYSICYCVVSYVFWIDLILVCISWWLGYSFSIRSIFRHLYFPLLFLTIFLHRQETRFDVLSLFFFFFALFISLAFECDLFVNFSYSLRFHHHFFKKFVRSTTTIKSSSLCPGPFLIWFEFSTSASRRLRQIDFASMPIDESITAKLRTFFSFLHLSSIFHIVCLSYSKWLRKRISSWVEFIYFDFN